MKIEFDAENHIYRVDGVPKLSVTQVLDANGLYPEYGKNEASARFGIIGHQTIKMMFDGTLAGYDPAFEPWMVGIRHFFKEQKPNAEYYEKIQYSEKYGFCGTGDFKGTVRNGKGVVYLDWKFWSGYSKLIARIAGFQTAGYKLLDPVRSSNKRGIVHFYPESYDIYWLNDPLDEVIFQSLLNVAKLKVDMGIYKFKERAIDESSTD